MQLALYVLFCPKLLWRDSGSCWLCRNFAGSLGTHKTDAESWCDTSCCGKQRHQRNGDSGTVYTAKDVAEFILKFYGDASEPNAKLVNLLLDRKAYLQLQEQKHQQEKEADALCAEIEEQQKLLQGIFQRFYSNQPYQDGFAAGVAGTLEGYNRLLERQKSILSEREKRKAEINRIENELREEFGKYYPTDEAEDFSEQLTRLENDRNELHKLNSEWDNAKKTREEAEIKTRELEGKIQEVLKKYKVYSEEIPYGEALETLRTKFTAYQNAAKT